MDVVNTVLLLRYNRAILSWAIVRYYFADYYTYCLCMVACEAYHDPSVTISIIHSTLSVAKAQETMRNVADMVEESVITRRQACGEGWGWDAGVNQDG
jgi:hypothetical protein